jgi:hypothetical protein
MTLDRLNLKGVRDGLAQAVGLIVRLRVQQRTAQEALDRATECLNDVNSMIAFAEQTRDYLRARLTQLEDE